MKPFITAALAIAAVTCTNLTDANALDKGSGLSGKFYQAKIEKCLGLGTLTPAEVDSLPDDQLKARLRKCDTPATNPAPQSAAATPIAAAPAPSNDGPAAQPDDAEEGGRRFGVAYCPPCCCLVAGRSAF